MREEYRNPATGAGRLSRLVARSPRASAVAALLAGLTVLGSAIGVADPALVAAQQPEPSRVGPLPTGSSSPASSTASTRTSEPAAPPGGEESTSAPEGSSATSPPPEGGDPETGGDEGAGQGGERSRLPLASEQSPDVRPGPGRTWTLTSSSLTLQGVQYHGFANREVAGEQVRTMHFTVDKLLIRDLVQRGDLGNGKVVRVSADPGSMSTITEGPVELYTRKLTGTLNVAGYPLVPVELSPEALLLPDVDLSFLELPELTFSDAVVRNAELSGGKLFIPGAEIALE